MNTALRGVLSFFGGLLINFVVLPRLTPVPLALIFWGIWAVILWFVLGHMKASASVTSGSWPADFTPTIAHRNLALDATSDRLWVRPMKGQPRIVTRQEILGWKHEYVESANAFRINQLKNCIVFRTADLKDPIFKVWFGRDHKTAEEWQARLTTWIK